jgi:hypothetical protein
VEVVVVVPVLVLLLVSVLVPVDVVLGVVTVVVSVVVVVAVEVAGGVVVVGVSVGPPQAARVAKAATLVTARTRLCIFNVIELFRLLLNLLRNQILYKIREKFLSNSAEIQVIIAK